GGNGTIDPSGPGERRQLRKFARSADRYSARKISCPMERRLSPCLASPADGREAGLLSGLRPRSAPAHRACARLGLRLSGRALGSSTRSNSWWALGAFVAARARELFPEPLSTPLPAFGRSSCNARRGNSSHGGARRHAACADAAAPVHGRRMGIDRAVSFLL